MSKSTQQFRSSEKKLTYVAGFGIKPTLDSLKPLLENIDKPSLLLLRGDCGLLPGVADFTVGKFKTLTDLEISSVSHLTTLPEGIFSELTQLQSLTLSYLPITHLPAGDLFSNLTHLQYLHLSSIPVQTLPEGIFSNLLQLRWLILRECRELLSIPCTENLTKLEVLDVSYCFELDKFESTVFPHPHLQMLNLSHTSVRNLPELIGTPNLTHIFLRKVAYEEIVHDLKGITSIAFLDLSKTSMSFIDFLSDLIHIRGLTLHECSSLKELPPMKKLTKLEVLDLSDCFELSDLPADLGDLKSLKELILFNCRGLQNLREGIFVNMSSLVTLDLSKCSSLTDLPEDLGCLKSLKQLNLSHCSNLERLREGIFVNMSSLVTLDLRECTKLTDLPEDLGGLRSLNWLDLSGCRGLKKLREGLFDQMSCLVSLYLSKTNVHNLPSFANLTSLRDLSLRDLELDSLESLASLTNLVDLDLMNLRTLIPEKLHLDVLGSLENLQTLDLSYTSVEQLPHISKLVKLKVLLLANCPDLIRMPVLQALTNLEHLDLSLAYGSTPSKLQVETESEDQRAHLFWSTSSLRVLRLRNRPGALKLFTLASLGNLEYLDVDGSDEIDDSTQAVLSKMGNLHRFMCQHDTLEPSLERRRRFSVDEFHVVSTFINNQPSIPSGFDRFKGEFMKLDDLVSSILQKNDKPALPDDTPHHEAFKRHFVSMCIDLRYIQQNIDLLESSRKAKSSEGLLNDLMDAATHLSADDFPLGSANLQEIIRMVVKLKLLLPPPPQQEKEEEQKKSKPRFTRRRRKTKEHVSTDEEAATHILKDTREMWDSYTSLTPIQRSCLLCFSVFPSSERLVIKKRMLFHWWFSEEFIDPQQHPKQTPYSSSVLKFEEVSDPEVEEVGQQILKVLEEKGFTEPVLDKRRISASCCMTPSVHSFVTAQAKVEDFFDFHHENGKLTPHFARSHRACLMKSEDGFSSSYKVWANYAKSSEKLESLESIRTVFNVNETIIDLKAEWFSKMKALHVLHLGTGHHGHEEVIEVKDNKLLEQFKDMKQLRLLSLQGFSTIAKLPDSICNLTNLKILNLRECTYLEELPSGIGSLKNLIHLDLTNCILLYMFPKGISLLSKLEVLKGFVITYEASGRQNRKACSLRDLSMLDSLRKLTLGVNVKRFPFDEDLQVFMDLRNLCSLKITWKKNYYTDKEPHDDIVQEDLRRSRWPQLKFWKQQTCENQTKEPSINNHLGNLKKLVLWCFPLETAPDWLNPSNLRNLENLYIMGGSLSTLPGKTNNTEWNVQILRLKYLSNLCMDGPTLKNSFPNMVYLEKHKCDKLSFLDCDNEGVWTKNIVLF